jgi:ABC-2 type transport system ATP-binding protein
MLIRMILRHLRAQEGSIKICGEDIEKRGPHSKGRVSAVLENPSYYRFMTGLDHLKMATRPYKDINVEMIREVVDRTGLKTCIRDKVATYTSKQRYMLAVAQALVTQPALLLLDEPTDDLDPVGIKNLRKILKEEAAKGVCVVVSSHILSEMDMLCTRIIIMKDGRFISDLSSHELLDPNRARVRIRVGQPERAYEVLEALFDDTTVRIDNDELIVTCENLQIPQMNRTLIFNEVDVYEIAVNREPLEEYFMELMREEE